MGFDLGLVPDKEESAMVKNVLNDDEYVIVKGCGGTLLI